MTSRLSPQLNKIAAVGLYEKDSNQTNQENCYPYDRDDNSHALTFGHTTRFFIMIHSALTLSCVYLDTHYIGEVDNFAESGELLLLHHGLSQNPQAQHRI